jgi:hypothetical protein
LPTKVDCADGQKAMIPKNEAWFDVISVFVLRQIQIWESISNTRYRKSIKKVMRGKKYMVMRPQVKEIRGKAANQHSRAHLCD